MSLAFPQGLRFRRVLDEGIVIQQERARVLGLNPTAARILELISQGNSKSEMVARLAEEFDVTVTELAADIDEFLQELVRRGILEIGEESP